MSIAEKFEIIADEVYKKGRKDEYDVFWDNLQDYGKRRNYWGAFCSWTPENFKPKYPIIATVAKSMFYMSTITEIDEIDVSGANSALDNTFDYAGQLVTIGKIIFSTNGTQKINAGFAGCNKLANITIEGNVGASISFATSPLSKASIENIISVLSTTATGKTLALKKTAKENAFTDEEWQTLIATKSNWTISLI